ncbi:MAG: hypothetical protein GF350_02525 [Chitinivibrionales bacterium]|nr:hypothetical protein [Chitinivibrionales bacterium]
MNAENMKRRTKAFKELPDTIAGKIVQGQIIRSGTSVGANLITAHHAELR